MSKPSTEGFRIFRLRDKRDALSLSENRRVRSELRIECYSSRKVAFGLVTEFSTSSTDYKKRTSIPNLASAAKTWLIGIQTLVANRLTRVPTRQITTNERSLDRGIASADLEDLIENRMERIENTIRVQT